MRCLDEEVILNVTNVVFFCCFFDWMVNKITNRSAINFLDVICSCPKPKQKPKNKHYRF